MGIQGTYFNCYLLAACYMSLCCMLHYTEQESDDFELRLIDLLLKDEADDVMLRRLPEIHRGTRIFMDPKGHNFCALQSLPNSWYVIVKIIVNSDQQNA